MNNPNQQPGAAVTAQKDDNTLADEAMTTEPIDNVDDNNNNNSNNNDNEEEEQQPVEDEPNWDQIMQHDPARTEVPIFLAARGRRDYANDKFATSLDILHESVTQGMEGLVEVVSTLLDARAQKLYEFEVELKNDYVHNEKTRANMNAKLEESARAAQGLFANLLMRVAQPDDSASVASGAAALGGNGGGANGNSGNENGVNDNDNDAGNGNEDEEPDWDAIMKHEPARSEVPTFLSARARREAACSRFETAIGEFQTSVDGYTQELISTMAEVYNNRTVKLDEYDQLLKHDYIENDKMRATMQSNLEESAAAAQEMFQSLLVRVMQPGLQESQQQEQHQQSMAGGMLTQAVTMGDSP